ncbi:MAG: sensor histidine kinase, partial [Clostridia bacterium]|nr:sensor histidine kinase [Clostridia bacterium]
AFSTLIILIVVSIASISYYVTGNMVEKNSGEYVYQLVKQVNYNIQYYLDNVETISKNIYYNKTIRDYLEGRYSDEILIKEEIANYLSNFVFSRNDILNIFIFAADSDRVIASDTGAKIKDYVDFKNQPWYIKAMDTDSIAVSESHVQNIIEGQYKWVVSCSYALKNHDESRNIGVLLIDLNFNLIDDMCRKIQLGKKGYVFILDSEGNIVYHPKQQLLYSDLKKEEIDLIMDSPDGNIVVEEEGLKKQYTITTSDYSGWKVIGAVYIDDISDYMPILRNFFLIMGIISLVIAIFLSILITRQILYPVNELTDAMNRFEDGEMDVSIDIKKNNEIGDLGKTFNHMVRVINNLIKQNQKEQEQIRKSELKALQAQINPHFLYNTLDSIVWMAEAKDYEKVTTMTSSLAKLFRISISKGRQFVPIYKEIEHVINYLKIQKIRYSNKLDYEINVEPEVMKYETIKLILQPIVENAIYHGIKNMTEPGKIVITGSKKGDRILFEVKDNGVGMSQETIKKLFDPDLKKTSKLSGVGIKNVDERIKLYFGEQYGLEIQSEIYEGTSVRIWLPVRASGRSEQLEDEI